MSSLKQSDPERSISGQERSAPVETQSAQVCAIPPVVAKSQEAFRRDVRGGFLGNGFWAVEVARAGTYEITLCRWPEEEQAPITASVDGGTVV